MKRGWPTYREHGVQQRGLARARRPQQRGDAAARQSPVNVGENHLGTKSAPKPAALRQCVLPCSCVLWQVLRLSAAKADGRKQSCADQRTKDHRRGPAKCILSGKGRRTLLSASSFALRADQIAQLGAQLRRTRLSAGASTTTPCASNARWSGSSDLMPERADLIRGNNRRTFLIVLHEPARSSSCHPVFLLLVPSSWPWAGGASATPTGYGCGPAASVSACSARSARRSRSLLRIGIYTAVFEHVALWRNDAF